MPAFHLAIPVKDLEETRKFYTEVLGCKPGRSAPKWLDFDFFGHQLSVHLKPEACELAPTNTVDGKSVPVSHFGLVMDWADWEGLVQRLESFNTEFIIEPYVRFEGEAGEQGTCFLRDPSGNHLEFKAFKDMRELFAA